MIVVIDEFYEVDRILVRGVGFSLKLEGYRRVNFWVLKKISIREVRDWKDYVLREISWVLLRLMNSCGSKRDGREVRIGF